MDITEMAPFEQRLIEGEEGKCANKYEELYRQKEQQVQRLCVSKVPGKSQEWSRGQGLRVRVSILAG